MIEIDIQLTQGTFRLEVTARFDGKATAIFGPSGAGKTTTLDAIAGLRRPDHGAIRIGGRTLFLRNNASICPPISVTSVTCRRTPPSFPT